MVLIKCKECGQMVSEKAKTCPQYGAPVKSGGTSLTVKLILNRHRFEYI